MGRPWWYDSYWQKGKKPKKKFPFPGGKLLTWLILLVLVALVALWRVWR